MTGSILLKNLRENEWQKITCYCLEAFFIFLFQVEALASQCIYKKLSPKEKMDQSSFVFEGKVFARVALPSEIVRVQSLGREYQFTREYAKYYFVISKHWKGAKQSILSVKAISGICSVDFQFGKDYLVYARGALENLETGPAYGTIGSNSFLYDSEDIDYLKALSNCPNQNPEISLEGYQPASISIVIRFTILLGLLFSVYLRAVVK